MLIFDICDFNYDDDILKKYIEISIILVLFPQYAAHFFHHLEIELFNNFNITTKKNHPQENYR